MDCDWAARRLDLARDRQRVELAARVGGKGGKRADRPGSIRPLGTADRGIGARGRPGHEETALTPDRDSRTPDRLDMLLGRVPGGLRARLTAATLVLEQYGPPVAEATRSLGRLSAELDVALRWPASLDPAELEPITDDEQAAVWRQLDWWEPWRIADELRDSHPDALTVEPERRSS